MQVLQRQIFSPTDNLSSNLSRPRLRTGHLCNLFVFLIPGSSRQINAKPVSAVLQKYFSNNTQLVFMDHWRRHSGEFRTLSYFMLSRWWWWINFCWSNLRADVRASLVQDTLGSAGSLPTAHRRGRVFGARSGVCWHSKFWWYSLPGVGEKLQVEEYWVG